jgi:hypothetical protein
MMRVVVKRPGFHPVVENVKPGLESMQSLVGGYIECAMRGHGFFDGDDLVIYCNEEGQRLNLADNVVRPTDCHLVVGAVVAVKVDKQGEDVSMTVEDARQAVRKLKEMGLPGDAAPLSKGSV